MGVDTRDSYRSTVNTLAILPMARILFRITSFLAAIVAPANDRQALKLAPKSTITRQQRSQGDMSITRERQHAACRVMQADTPMC